LQTLDDGSYIANQAATIEWLPRLFFCAVKAIYPLDRGGNRFYTACREQRVETSVLRAFCFDTDVKCVSAPAMTQQTENLVFGLWQLA
jgi:hypothetical protein